MGHFSHSHGIVDLVDAKISLAASVESRPCWNYVGTSVSFSFDACRRTKYIQPVGRIASALGVLAVVTVFQPPPPLQIRWSPDWTTLHLWEFN